MPKQHAHQAKRWLWTLFQYESNQTPKEWFEKFEEIQYINWQEEKCPETGKMHLQGYFELKEKRRITELKRMYHPTCHWGDQEGKPAYGTREENIKYTSKENSKVEGPWEHSRIEIKEKKEKISKMDKVFDMIQDGATLDEITKQMKGYYIMNKQKIDLFYYSQRSKQKLEQRVEKSKKFYFYDWHIKAMDLLKKQDDREILWVYNPEGGAAKTSFSKYLQDVHGAFVTEGGKNSDIIHMYNEENVIIFDYAMSSGEKIQCDLIERFKNGNLVSHKYEGRQKVCLNPKVMVLSNSPVPEEGFSKTRKVSLMQLEGPYEIVQPVTDYEGYFN